MAIKELALTGIGTPPFSIRGVQQSLTMISEATNLRRTMNGGLVDVGNPAFRKYASSITCDDMTSPAFDELWSGRVLTVDCVVELAQVGDVAEGALGRTIVPGSRRVANGFTFYRPRLTMAVIGWDFDRDEWGGVVSWTLELEEV